MGEIDVVWRTGFLAYLQGIETRHSHSDSLTADSFLAYLQGIETAKPGTGTGTGSGFLAYLQGIETLVSGHSYKGFDFVFSVPTRD